MHTPYFVMRFCMYNKRKNLKKVKKRLFSQTSRNFSDINYKLRNF